MGDPLAPTQSPEGRFLDLPPLSPASKSSLSRDRDSVSEKPRAHTERSHTQRTHTEDGKEEKPTLDICRLSL